MNNMSDVLKQLLEITITNIRLNIENGKGFDGYVAILNVILEEVRNKEA